jgi:hypothetical protein
MANMGNLHTSVLTFSATSDVSSGASSVPSSSLARRAAQIAGGTRTPYMYKVIQAHQFSDDGNLKLMAELIGEAMDQGSVSFDVDLWHKAVVVLGTVGFLYAIR